MLDFKSKTYIRFSAGNDPISWAIQARTACKWSHCDLLLPDGSLLGSLPGGGVQARSRIHGETRFAICEVPVVEGASWAESQIGKPYDWGAVLGLASPLPIRRNWADPHFFFCSELAFLSIAHAGLNLLQPHSWGITPRDLWCSSLVTEITTTE